MWKLNAGLERLLLLGMEIALSHVISHAKALLSTFTSFAFFTIKRIHGATVLLGRWIHFHSLTGMESVGTREISHANTTNTADFQSFPEFDICVACSLLNYRSHRFYNTLQQICKLITPQRFIWNRALQAERGQLMDVKMGLLPYIKLLLLRFFKYNTKSIEAVRKYRATTRHWQSPENKMMN